MNDVANERKATLRIKRRAVVDCRTAKESANEVGRAELWHDQVGAEVAGYR